MEAIVSARRESQEFKRTAAVLSTKRVPHAADSCVIHAVMASDRAVGC